jgi:hypothetical protein
LILLRARQWGSADWTHITISSVDEDDPSLESSIMQIIGSALDTSSLHVQLQSPDGSWEDLDAA